MHRVGDYWRPEVQSGPVRCPHVSTSAWISDQYVSVPFWPSSLHTAPLGPAISETEEWTAPSLVLNTEMNCEPMRLTSVGWFNRTWHADYDGSLEYEVMSYVVLSSDSGCRYRLVLDNSSIVTTQGGSSWSHASNFSTSTADNSEAFVDYSGCPPREIIIASTAWH
jgi:hypothetical protein